MNRWIVTGVAMLWISAAAVGAQKTLPRVLLIGDSISIGYTGYVQHGLRGIAEVRHAPANCGPTTRGVAQLDKWLNDEHWDLIHFNFGLHDIVFFEADRDRHAQPDKPGAHHQVSAEDYEQNLRTIVNRLKQTGAKLIWCTTTPVPEGSYYRISGDEVTYNEIAERVMRESGIQMLDLYAFAKPRLEELQLPNNVHFTPDGYKALGSHIAEVIAAALSETQSSADSPDASERGASTFIPVTDTNRVTRIGEWWEGGGPVDGRARNRYCWPFHLRTKTPGAKLALEFEGTGLSVVFHTPRVRAYGSYWKDNQARVSVDGSSPLVFTPESSPSEVLVADNLQTGAHRAVFEHLTNGCTLAGFRVFREPVGHVSGTLTGDNPDKLFNVRVKVWQGEDLVRTSLNRNWVCGRFAVTGLPPGGNTRIRVSAVGWLPWEREGVTIKAGETVNLGSIHLNQDPATKRGPIEWPALGEPSVCVPGDSFEVRGGEGGWMTARLVRRSGPAVISRATSVKDRKVQVQAGMSIGMYDLHLMDGAGNTVVSPRAVVVRKQQPVGSLTLVVWGHTDTWGEHQAEFEKTLVGIANIVGPDVVLISNSLNPAYVSGALADLDSPFVINFGNHALRGHEEWFGSEVGLLDLGPNFVVFNFGDLWKEDDGTLAKLMHSRMQVPGKILNSLESDYPLPLFEEVHLRLTHDGHGWLKPKVLVLPGTETMRVGKRTASSFRIIRMENYRVVSVSDPLEVPRIEDPARPVVPDPPLRVAYDGTAAQIVNELPVPVENARVVMVLPRGEYSARDAKVESAVLSDDGQWTELVLRADVEANSTRQLILTRKD